MSDRRPIVTMTDNSGRIMKMRQPSLPEFGFEYHPTVQKVYVIQLFTTLEHKPISTPIGELIADNIDNAGRAHSAVLIWCRGYKRAAYPDAQRKEDKAIVAPPIEERK